MIYLSTIIYCERVFSVVFNNNACIKYIRQHYINLKKIKKRISLITRKIIRCIIKKNNTYLISTDMNAQVYFKELNFQNQNKFIKIYHLVYYIYTYIYKCLMQTPLVNRTVSSR